MKYQLDIISSYLIYFYLCPFLFLILALFCFVCLLFFSLCLFDRDSLDSLGGTYDLSAPALVSQGLKLQVDTTLLIYSSVN